MEDAVGVAKAAGESTQITTRVSTRDPWAVAGISSLRGDSIGAKTFHGGKLVALWCLATSGDLKSETELIFAESEDSSKNTARDSLDLQSLRRIQSSLRGELDCYVCYSLFHDPFTTSCGHTFCRSCLNRTLDHSRRCPMCRCVMVMSPILDPGESPPNQLISKIIDTLWPEEKAARAETVQADIVARYADLDVPLFVLTLAFPGMPTFLHIFEPRYRLMIRRAYQGNRTFGMVLPKPRFGPEEPNFYEIGTMLYIRNVQLFPDGRSIINTVGVNRFRVLRHGELDGYAVAKTERIDDISLEEEEAAEASEVAAYVRRKQELLSESLPLSATDEQQTLLDGRPAVEGTEEQEWSPHSMDDLSSMSTQRLLEYAIAFVNRMSTQGVPWLNSDMASIHGRAPNDAAQFPWWFSSLLPIKHIEKYRLFETTSVRERLKICCMWCIEWRNARW